MSQIVLETLRALEDALLEIAAACWPSRTTAGSSTASPPTSSRRNQPACVVGASAPYSHGVPLAGELSERCMLAK